MPIKDFKTNNTIIIDNVSIDLSSATNSGGLVYSSSSNSYVSSSGNIPIGVVRLWASGSSSPVVPDDYLICDGRQDLSQTTYADLYAVIGNRFTTSPNGSTFGLPSFNSATKQYPLVIGINTSNHSSPFNQTANENTLSIGSTVNLSHTHTSSANYNFTSATSSTLSHSHNANDTTWIHNHDFDGTNTENSTSHQHGVGNASLEHNHNHFPGNNQPVLSGGASGNHTHNTSGTNQVHNHTSTTGNHNHPMSNPSGSNSNVHSHTFSSNLNAASPTHAHSADTSGFYFIIRYR
jgi:hypothetical protein